MKLFSIAIVALSLSLSGCKKKKEEAPKEAPKAAEPVKSAAPAEPVKPAIPEIPVPVVALSGTPGADMISVFSAGMGVIAASNGNAAAAAKGIKTFLTKNDVAKLRADAKAAKEAGKGATDEQKTQFKALTEGYKAAADKFGSDNGAWMEAHKAWSQAWGLN